MPGLGAVAISCLEIANQVRDFLATDQAERAAPASSARPG
jgi:hypothetical protein